MKKELHSRSHIKPFKYVVYEEGKFYVSQCLNVDVSSFGKTIDEAVDNLKEAVELYLEDDMNKTTYHAIGNTLVIGESVIHV